MRVHETLFATAERIYLYIMLLIMFYKISKYPEILEFVIFTKVTVLMVNFISFSEIDKMKCILNPTDFRQVKSLGSFLKSSVELRTGDPQTNKPDH